MITGEPEMEKLPWLTMTAAPSMEELRVMVPPVMVKLASLFMRKTALPAAAAELLLISPPVIVKLPLCT